MRLTSPGPPWEPPTAAPWHALACGSKKTSTPRRSSEPGAADIPLELIHHETEHSQMTTTADHVPANLVVDFDVYDPRLATPVDVMQERVAEMATKGPVVFSPAYGGHWIVIHYKEIHQVLTDPQTFSSYPNNLVTPADFGKFIPLELDPPDHTATARCCS